MSAFHRSTVSTRKADPRSRPTSAASTSTAPKSKACTTCNDHPSPPTVLPRPPSTTGSPASVLSHTKTLPIPPTHLQSSSMLSDSPSSPLSASSSLELGSPTKKNPKQNKIEIKVKKFSGETLYHSLDLKDTPKDNKKTFSNTKISPRMSLKTEIKSNLDEKTLKTPQNLKKSQNLQNSHTKITVSSSNNLPKELWPKKIIKCEEIINKPWYELTFEEIIELNGGEERREEIYGNYNKSFVTKLNPNLDLKKTISFGSSVKSPRFEKTRDEKNLEILLKNEKKLKNSEKNEKNSEFLLEKNSKKKKILTENEKKIIEERKNKFLIKKNIKTLKLSNSLLNKKIESLQQNIKNIKKINEKNNIFFENIKNETKNSENYFLEINLKTFQLLKNLKENFKILIEEKNLQNENYLKLNNEIKKWENIRNRNENSILQNKTLYYEKIQHYEDLLIEEFSREDIRLRVLRGLLRFARKLQKDRMIYVLQQMYGKQNKK